MSAVRVRFTFPPDLVTQPIVYLLGNQFAVVPNILRANIDRDRGWIILDITGDEAEIERALSWVREQGVAVEQLENEPGP